MTHKPVKSEGQKVTNWQSYGVEQVRPNEIEHGIHAFLPKKDKICHANVLWKDSVIPIQVFQKKDAIGGSKLHMLDLTFLMEKWCDDD